MQVLLDRLRRIRATGSDGFEGLVCDLLCSVTSRPFRLVKSGPQGGLDGLQDRAANTVRIGFEGKRYAKGLPLDALKYKLYEATTNEAGVDVWVLATTRGLDAGDSEQLQRQGDESGVAVAILDWTVSRSQLPRLGVLCAAAPDVVTKFLGSDPDLESDLDTIRLAEGFSVALNGIRDELSAPDVGYASVKLAATRWLREALNDRTLAKARLGDPYGDLLADFHVRRESLEQGLDAWWGEGCPESPIVLLGDEGVGKTWGFLSWWLARAGEEGEDLPLTLFVPANRISGQSVHQILADSLALVSDHRRGGEFWEKRLRIWAPTSELNPARRILLVVDGLNQNWKFSEWATFLEDLFIGDLAGLAATVLTCRPDHWRVRLKRLSNFAPKVPTEQRVSSFSEDELSGLLGMHNLALGDLDPNLREMARIPRLFRLILSVRERLRGRGDVTREMVVVEDWRSRLNRLGTILQPTEEDFVDFVAEIGSEIRSSILSGDPATSKQYSRELLVAKLGRGSGATSSELGATLSEIVDGRWFEKDADHLFRLNNELVPFALGLALVADLKALDPEALDGRLADFFDPLRGQDFAVELLRAAYTVAAIDLGVSDALKELLLEAWITSHNFRSKDFESLWRLGAAHPEHFLNFAERVWLGEARGGLGTDELLIKSIANMYEFDHVRPLVEERLIRWLSTYWLDPYRGSFISFDPDEAKAQKRRDKTVSRERAWRTSSRHGHGTDELWCALPNSHASWLAHRALGVLSFLPRAPFVNAFRGWALTRGIMGMDCNFDSVAWVLRLNTIDPAETVHSISKIGKELIATGEDVGVDGGTWLLKALATADAVRDLSDETLKFSVRTYPNTAHVSEGSSRVGWNHAEALTWPRSIETPLDATAGLSRFACNPNLSLPDEDCEVLAQLAERSATGELFGSLQVTSADHAFETALLALARWAPGSLTALIRRVARSVSLRSPEDMVRLLRNFDGWLLALHADELAEIGRTTGHFCNALQVQKLVEEYPVLARIPARFQRRILKGLIAIRSLFIGEAVGPPELEDQRKRGWGEVEQYSLLARLVGQGASEQIDALARLPDGPGLFRSFAPVLAAPSRADYEVLAEKLAPALPESILTGWLWYLRLAPLDNIPDGYEAVALLFTHPEPRVRLRAFQLLNRVENPGLQLAMRNSSWACSNDMLEEEKTEGSVALCRSAGDLPVGDIVDRVDRQALALLVDRRQARDDDLDEFADYVRSEISNIIAGDRPFRDYWNWRVPIAAVRVLVQKRPREVESWLEPIRNNELGFSGAFSNVFPIIAVCHALLIEDPETGADLWRSLRASYDRHLVRNDYFERLPLAVPAHSAVLRLREKIVEDAKTDWELNAIATEALAAGYEDWLLERIGRDLDGAVAGQTARGLCLAGYLDASAASEALWGGRLLQPPARGWLDTVHSRARASYHRNLWARHWFTEFLGARDCDNAFGYFELFVACADRRARHWAPSLFSSSSDGLPQALTLHFRIRWPDLSDELAKGTREAGDSLFGERTNTQTQSPWL